MQGRHSGEPLGRGLGARALGLLRRPPARRAMAHATPDHARITLPGAAGGYGRAVDGLEGFARTFILAAFRLAGEQGRGLEELADFYARGVTAGTDPDGANRWVRMDYHPQAKVEAASIALALDLTRPWIWDRLTSSARERVIEYLSPVVGDETYPRTNWLWFRVVVETFLRSVGGPWSRADIDEDLALHDSFYRADGWLSDGAERAYDHYTGWALHLYPVLWARMCGAGELAGERSQRDVARLDRFLVDALALVGGNGSPLIEGRSLSYRFAAAAPFWAGVLAGVPSSSPGQLRYAASAVVGHFAAAGVPGAGDVLTLGWHHEWRALAQAYSGPGSPYWAVKGLLGVALPAGHPVWSAAAEPLPVEAGDTLRVIRAPGWLVSGTRADGIVRVVNHGTDHASPGELTGDSPLYARLGYSTATSPLLDDEAWLNPLEQAVAITDARGRATHRTALTPLAASVDASGAVPVAVGGSTWRAHWLTPDERQQRHGSGLAGIARGRGTGHGRLHCPRPLGVPACPGRRPRRGPRPGAAPAADRRVGAVRRLAIWQRLRHDGPGDERHPAQPPDRGAWRHGARRHGARRHGGRMGEQEGREPARPGQRGPLPGTAGRTRPVGRRAQRAQRSTPGPLGAVRRRVVVPRRGADRGTALA